MEIRNRVSLGDVVKALNVEPPSSDESERFSQRYRAAAGDLPRHETTPFTYARLSHDLRGWVDAWLETGRRADGREFPWERQLQGRGFLMVLQYLQRYPPSVELSPGAGLTVYMDSRAVHPRGPGKLYLAVAAEAERLFTGLIVSEQKQCLCKCAYANCGKYFQLAKPRRVYRRGTFCCRSHQMADRALYLTRDRRIKATEKLIELAALELISRNVRSAEWAKSRKQKLHLAKALSQQIRRDPNLRANRVEARVNWVTRHREEIEQTRVRLAKQQPKHPPSAA